MKARWFLPVLLLGACGDDGGGSGDDSGSPAVDAAPNPNPADARVGPDATPNTAMSFFATSTGSGANGGNLGGLSGADAKCQELADNAGAGGRTWRAYLSTGDTGPGDTVDAKDRIGAGPWFNHGGVMVAASVASLHTSGIDGALILDESGAAIPGNEHDILTGSSSDGTLDDSYNTCANWTDGTENYQRTVGHADNSEENGESWNSQHTGSCDQQAILNHAGSGRIYCFAID